MLRDLVSSFGATDGGFATAVRLLRSFQSPREFLFRAAYETSKRSGVHRRWLFPSQNVSAEEIYACFPDVRTPQQLLERLRARTEPAFFIGPADRPRYQSLLQARPHTQVSALLSAADRVAENRFVIFGHSIKFGKEVDWHAAIAAPERWPLRHWSEIEFRSAGKPADVKFCWELNRHQHFVLLGRAYWASGDEKYAQAFARQTRSWLDQNPPEQGVNWASSLEIALRAISWTWALYFFLSSSALSAELAVDMLRALRASGRHLTRDLWFSEQCSPRNNHLIGEATGLLWLGLFLPEFPEARSWRRRGLEILLREQPAQVLSDGTDFEMAVSYHRLVYGFFLLSGLALRRTGCELPPEFWHTLERMAEFLSAIAMPGGALPQIGDGDDGLVVSLATEEARSCRALLSTAAALFDRSQLAPCEASDEESFWLLGPEALANPPEVRPQGAAVPASFPSGGFYLSRSAGKAAGSNSLLFRCGPHGLHGHADQLHVEVYDARGPLLVDSGTFSYSADARWRSFFRGTSSHNTMIVDGQDQSLALGHFRWLRRANGRLLWESRGPASDSFCGEHDGYAHGRCPVRHRRTVLFLKPECILIVDTIHGSGIHTADLLFHFTPRTDVRQRDANRFAISDGNRARAWLLVFCSRSPSAEVVTGQLDPIQGWYSEGYGQKVPNPCLSLQQQGSGPLRFISVLQLSAAPPDVKVIRGLDDQEMDAEITIAQAGGCWACVIPWDKAGHVIGDSVLVSKNN
ncbi:MAG: heparinase II/III family protein [Acidobacteriota bacterium]|nr:heparinase II/III family protein [Acidobacteriota bacterium]